MSFAQEEIKNRVREAADIVQVIGESVQLKKAGTRFSGLCPFHNEKTPSFSVNPQGQFFHCFGCGESGDVFSFMMKYHHLTFPEALKDLAQRYQIDLPERKMSEADRKRMHEREQLYLVNHEAAKLYQSCLQSDAHGKEARAYLKQRGVNQEFIKKYGLGYVPSPESGGWKYITSRLQGKKFSIIAIEQAGLAVKKERGGHYDRFRDRVLFPIYNMSGREIAFGGRILGEGKPKYMNSPESMIFEKNRILFGLYQHREAIRKSRQAIVVEGNFDLLLLAVHGIDNVVAPLGTALSRSHVKSLRGYCDEVVLLFDGDSAGFKAARRSIPFFLSEQVEARVALLPEGHDPDTLVREKGAQGIRELIDDALPLPEFVFSALVREHGLTLSGKNKIMQELSSLVREATDPNQRELMAAHFSEQLGVAPALLLSGTPELVEPESVSMPVPGPVPEPDLEPDIDSERVPSENIIFIAKLPRKQRQLLDFIVLYPEYLEDLLQGGLAELDCTPPLLTVIDCLKKLKTDGVVMPEQLLSVLPENMERQYFADLLMRGGEDDTDTTQGRGVCDELLVWLKSVALQRKSADLQEQLIAAQQAGDIPLQLELIKKKHAIVKKK